MWQHSATLTLGSQKTAPNRWAEDSHWGKIPSSNHTEKLGMAEWAWDKKQLYACRRLTIIHALSSYWNGETWNKKRHGGREGGKKRGKGGWELWLRREMCVKTVQCVQISNCRCKDNLPFIAANTERTMPNQSIITQINSAPPVIHAL